MSFASQAREEIAQHSLQLQKDCCVRAAAYGIACFAKYFDAKGLVLQTEQELTARVAEQLFARCGVRGTILEKSRPSGVVYEFGIREPEQVMRLPDLRQRLHRHGVSLRRNRHRSKKRIQHRIFNEPHQSRQRL